MSAVRGPVSLGAAPPPDARARIRKMAHELEGVFLNQLFQAMRASVPRDGVLEAAPGQDLFTSLLDERLASQAAGRTQGSIGEALYRQMVKRLPPEGADRKAEATK
jgi:peptidoglycan hydrolase FlgJ